MRKQAWIRALTALALASWSAGVVRGQIVDLRATWPKGDCMKNASEALSKRFRVTAPGRLEVTVLQEPYRHAGRATFTPEAWTSYVNGKSLGWDMLGAGIQGRAVCSAAEITQNGKPARNFLEGVPLKTVYACELKRGEFDLEVRLGPPAMNYGCGFTQWGQNARLTVTYTGGGSAAVASPPSVQPPATLSPPVAPGGIAGIWNMNAGGYGSKIEITKDGAAYLIREASGVQMHDVKFDPATGTIEFKRGRAGYPDQVFTGVLLNGRFEGKFRFATEKPGTGVGWTASRP